MDEPLPVALVCTSCGNVSGALLNTSCVETRGNQSLTAICSSCTASLSQEKGITLDSPENWAKLLED